MAAVIQQRMLPADRLQPLLAPERTLPHRGVYLAVAGDIAGGAHSLLEIDFHRLARAARIPAPIGQAVRLDRFGRRRYLDADFGSFAVEADGAIHLRPLEWWDDARRLNEIVLADKPILRFPSVAIYLRRAEVIDQLQRAARRWPP